MDIRSIIASQNYGSSATRPVPGSGDGPAAALGQVARNFETTLRQAEQTATRSMVEPTDPHELVQALTQAELAVDTAVNIRNKLVEAYTEILRMPV